MLKKLLIHSAFVGMAAMAMTGCKDEREANARFEVRMTDSPGEYESVKIDIKGIEVNVSSDPSSSSGWQPLANFNSGVYDLLKLTNGADVLLGSAELPAGTISQIRLVLGTNNSVTIKGQEYKLSTPSAQQSGLKLNINATLEAGITYKLLLDFDAGRSVVKAGNSGKYNLKPVIRAIAEAQSGAIKGMVTPAASAPAVMAITGTDTTGTYADANGYFLIKGLKPGTYKVVFQPKPTYTQKMVDNVSVSIGNVTNMNTVTLQ